MNGMESRLAVTRSLAKRLVVRVQHVLQYRRRSRVRLSRKIKLLSRGQGSSFSMIYDIGGAGVRFPHHVP